MEPELVCHCYYLQSKKGLESAEAEPVYCYYYSLQTGKGFQLVVALSSVVSEMY